MNKLGLTLFTFLLSIALFAQVGINIPTPAADAALDVSGTDKGVLIPRVDIEDLSTIAPVTGGSTESLLVYNSNTITGKGFYFWSGTEWVPVGRGVYWEKNGNSGTTPGTAVGENYLGTSDAQDLVIATNGSEKMRVTAAGQVLANATGTATAPTYSFHTDQDTGVFSDGSDKLNFAAGGRNMFEIDGPNSQIVLNPDRTNANTRIASRSESHMLLVNSNTNRVGIAQHSPRATLHVGGSNSTVRIDALNSINNPINNTGGVATPVFVDAVGELSTEGPNAITRLVVDDSSFLSMPVVIDNTASSRTTSLIYDTDITLTRDALVEVVYQAGINITDTSDAVIVDGKPRVYRMYVLINGNKVAYKGDAYTSSAGTATNVVTGPFYLNANGYVQLPGVSTGTPYTIEVYAEVFGNTSSTRCTFGGNGDDLFQVLVRY